MLLITPAPREPGVLARIWRHRSDYLYIAPALGVMLLVIGIVGTTVAPWQLFFQQSYIIDKRITPRFMRYEKADLWIGIIVVVIGGGALMGAAAAAFAGSRQVPFTDAAGLAAGLAAYAGHAAGVEKLHPAAQHRGSAGRPARGDYLPSAARHGRVDRHARSVDIVLPA